MASGAATGAVQGVASGAAFGPVGAVIGGVAGMLFGAFGDKAKARARLYTARANTLRENAYKLRSFAEQRNLLRQGQVTAAAGLNSAAAMGADVSSSAFQGSTGSIYSQLIDNYLTGANILGYQLEANKYDLMAGKQAGRVNTYSDILGAASQLVRAIPHSASKPSVDVSGVPLDAVHAPPRRNTGQVQTFAIPDGN